MHFVSSCRKIKLSTTKAIYFDMPFFKQMICHQSAYMQIFDNINYIENNKLLFVTFVTYKVIYPSQVSLTEDGITHVLSNWRMKWQSKCSFFTANPCVQLWNEVINFNLFVSFFPVWSAIAPQLEIIHISIKNLAHPELV